MSLQGELTDRFADAFERLGMARAHGEVVVSQRPELGQFQCNGALAVANAAGISPRDVAATLVDAVVRGDLIADLSIAGPGFVNITVSDGALAAWTERVASDDRLGVPATDGQRLVVDFGGPNVAKAMHVGHLRSTIIGDSLQRLARFVGDEVTTDIHFGDWGTQMGMLIVAVQEEQPDLVYFAELYAGPYPDTSPVTLDDLQRLYPDISRRVGDDAMLAERVRLATYELQQGRPGYRALWEHFVRVSQDSQRRDFHDLGVDFDLWYGESTVHDRIEPLIESMRTTGVARVSEGAIVVDVAETGDKAEIPPLLLTKADGAYLYSSTDVATVDLRVRDLGAESIWYVVDSRQALHFEQVFRAARKAGVLPESVTVEHIGFGTMNGPDGKPFQTRTGGVVRLADLIAMVREAAYERLDEQEIAAEYPAPERDDIATKVGLAALKYGDLANQRTTNTVFDLRKFTDFAGKTGPYLLYGAVRVRSLLRNAADRGLAPGSVVPPDRDAVRALMLRILRFPEVVDRAYALRAPNHLAEYAYELTGDLNRFYEACHVLSEDDRERQASWLTLIAITGRVLERTLDLLGIAVPDRM